MSDTTLRELERALLESPQDAAIAGRFVSAVNRAGGEPLKALTELVGEGDLVERFRFELWLPKPGEVPVAKIDDKPGRPRHLPGEGVFAPSAPSGPCGLGVKTSPDQLTAICSRRRARPIPLERWRFGEVTCVNCSNVFHVITQWRLKRVMSAHPKTTASALFWEAKPEHRAQASEQATDYFRLVILRHLGRETRTLDQVLKGQKTFAFEAFGSTPS